MHKGQRTDEHVYDVDDSKRVTVWHVYDGDDTFTQWTDVTHYDYDGSELETETTSETRTGWQRQRTLTDLAELGYTRTH